MENTAFLLVAAVLLTTLTSIGVFFLMWLFWLRNVKREVVRMHDHYLGGDHTAKEPPKELLEKAELVAQFKVRTGGKTISVLESDGKRFIRVEGELSRQERAQMLRYLKAEGFIG